LRHFYETMIRKFSPRQFFYKLKEFLYQLLRVDVIRGLIANIRYFFLVVLFRRLKTLDLDTGDIGVNAVHHNKLRLTTGMSVPRSNLLLYPLSSIHLSRSTPILSIGPRSEGEILNIKSFGFRNIRGLDLISYSPWVDLGDMHAMPYADNTFGVVIIGWVLAYSDNRMKAAKEALRVVKDGGIIAVGVEYLSDSAEVLSKKVGYELCDTERMESVAEILDLFGGNVDHVYFSQDLPNEPCTKWDLLALFSVKKAAPIPHTDSEYTSDQKER